MKDYLLQLYYDDFFMEIDLSKNFNKKITIGSDESNTIVLHSMNVERCCIILHHELNQWFIEDPNRSAIIINGRNIEKKKIELGDVYEVVSPNKKAPRMLVEVLSLDRFDKTYEKFDISDETKIEIGSNKASHIMYQLTDHIDDLAFSIYKEKSSYFIGDIASKKYKNDLAKKCIFVNGRRIYSDFQLKDQDLIFIGGYELIFSSKSVSKVIEGYEINKEIVYLSVSNTSIDVSVNHLSILEEDDFDTEDDNYFEIQSRLVSELDENELVIEKPRTKMNKPEINWISVLLPPVIMAVAFMVIMPMLNSSGAGYGGMFIIFSGIAVITSVVNYVTQVNKYKKECKNRVTDYEKLLDNKRNKLVALTNQEKDNLYHNHLDFSSMIHTVVGRERRLWERSYFHQDFLQTKVGMGDQELSVAISVPTIDESAAEKDELVEKAHKLKKEFSIIENVPITIDLIKNNVVSLLGHQGQVDNIIRTMITQITTNHSYEEVKLVFVFKDSDLGKWEWVKWLPHVWDSSRQLRYIATTKEDAKHMLTNINEVIKERLSEEKKNAMEVINLPHYVFFIADRDIILNNQIVSQLIAPKEGIGISTVFALSDTDWVPQRCSCEIKVDHLKGELIRDGVRNKIQLFESEDISLEKVTAFAREIAPIRIKNMASSIGMPSHVSLFDVLGIKDLKDYNLENKWKTNKAYESLKTPIGMKMGNEIFNFDIHEKEHGPHGLVAGTTGSGKSETLLAYLVSLAMNYHPHYVGFIIIDYKGGGMINDIERLPHLMGSITNLDDNEIQRSLLSLKSELKRRQRLFDKFKINHIDAYQKLFKDKIADEALPHLLLIVDEFAELKADQPEFMKELISAARIGRSLGLHLILATQKPSGVVDDQIWSNSKFKICLKVSTPEDSREVLKKSDASYITLPGRAYIQVGNDELFELFQSAYGGVEYKEQENIVEEPTVYSVELNGRRTQIYPKSLGFIEKTNKKTQLKKLVSFIDQETTRQEIVRLESPWKPALHEKYSLANALSEEELIANKEDYRIHIGRYDNPGEQEQGSFYLDLTKSGSIGIQGNAAMGKTTILESIAMYIIQSYTPDEINLYMIDFASRILTIFKDAPHVGGVILNEETDRLERLLGHLGASLKSRKNEFTNQGVTNIKAYNAIGKHKLAAIVVLIDNISYLKEIEDKNYEASFTSLIREGMNYGIYFIVTVGGGMTLSYKVASAIPSNIALHLNDKSEYTSLFGTSTGIVPKKVPGRGIAIFNSKIVEFQGYLPEHGSLEHEITTNIKEKINEISKRYENPDVVEIASLSDALLLSEYLILAEVNTKEPSMPLNIGLEISKLTPATIHLNDFGGFVLTGDRKTGITNGISMLIKNMIHNYNDLVEIFVLDNFLNELAVYKDTCTCFATPNLEDEEIERIKASIADKSKRSIIVINDFTYLDKTAGDIVKSYITKVIGEALYTNTNVFITYGDGQIAGYDGLSMAVKKIDSGVVSGHADNGLAQLGIKVSYETKKDELKPGQGYLQSVRDTLKLQLFMNN